MGDDLKSSVADRYHRAHGVRNMFPVDVRTRRFILETAASR